MKCLMFVLLAIFVFCCLCPVVLLGAFYFFLAEPMQDQQEMEVSIHLLTINESDIPFTFSLLPAFG